MTTAGPEGAAVTLTQGYTRAIKIVFERTTYGQWVANEGPLRSAGSAPV